MNILVTGSEGYIGTVLVKQLISEGFSVVGLDTCYFADGNLDKNKLPKYRLIQKDIRDVVLEDLQEEYFDAIIHLAALSNDPLGMIDETLTYDINHHASVRLAELAKEAGITRFIFSSSCSLYGDGNGKILDETSVSNPQTAYGKSKILAESEITKLADNSFSPVFMRNATAFGFSSRMRFDIVVNSLTGYATVEKEIKILGDGKPWRPLVHVNDICKAFITVLKAPKTKIHNEIFNVGSDKENYQIKTIAEHVKKHTNCQISIAQTDSGDARDYNVSFKKIQECLDFRVDFPVDKGIVDLLDVYTTIALKDEFYNKLYTRLKQIQYLQKNNHLDEKLRWIK